MSNVNIEKEIEMCTNLIKKFEEGLIECKKDYDFLKEQEATYGETEEHQKAVAAFKERSEGIKITVKVLKERLNKLNEKKSKMK